MININNSNLKILPKYEDYIVYVNCILVKIPKDILAGFPSGSTQFSSQDINRALILS